MSFTLSISSLHFSNLEETGNVVQAVLHVLVLLGIMKGFTSIPVASFATFASISAVSAAPAKGGKVANPAVSAATEMT
jgi:hypothetical protein